MSREISELGNSNFLKATGLLEAYEHCLTSMINEGWPSDTTIFEHAAYLILEYQTDHKAELLSNFAVFKNRLKLRERTGKKYLKGTTDDPKVQARGMLALPSTEVTKSKPKQISERRAIGSTTPTKMVLKSKKSHKYKNNPID